MESLAFDRDGYLYVANGSGTVAMYSPAHAVVYDPFARTNFASGYTMALVFGRDAGGAMTSRLFATNPLAGAMLQMNPAGMRAPWWRIGVGLLLTTLIPPTAGTTGGGFPATIFRPTTARPPPVSPPRRPN